MTPTRPCSCSTSAPGYKEAVNPTWTTAFGGRVRTMPEPVVNAGTPQHRSEGPLKDIRCRLALRAAYGTCKARVGVTPLAGLSLFDQ
jgi:hypothetical protein